MTAPTRRPQLVPGGEGRPQLGWSYAYTEMSCYSIKMSNRTFVALLRGEEQDGPVEIPIREDEDAHMLDVALAAVRG